MVYKKNSIVVFYSLFENKYKTEVRKMLYHGTLSKYFDCIPWYYNRELTVCFIY